MNDEIMSNERKWIVCENSQMKKKITDERKFTNKKKKNSQMKNLTQVK